VADILILISATSKLLVQLNVRFVCSEEIARLG